MQIAVLIFAYGGEESIRIQAMVMPALREKLMEILPVPEGLPESTPYVLLAFALPGGTSVIKTNTD